MGALDDLMGYGSRFLDSRAADAEKFRQGFQKNPLGHLMGDAVFAMGVLPVGPKRPPMAGMGSRPLQLESRFAQEPPQAGFTPSQMRQLLNEEGEQIVNMWHEAKSPMPENAGDHYRMVRKGYERELGQQGLLNLESEDAVRQALLDRRLSGTMVQPTKPEIIE